MGKASYYCCKCESFHNEGTKIYSAHVIYDSDVQMPSNSTLGYWIYAFNDNVDYEDSEKVGKWMFWRKREVIDEIWNQIKIAIKDGLLGIQAKVSTALPNPNSRDPNKYVIMVYTYDFSDLDDLRRVRRELTKLGVTERIPYKTDAATRAGIYGKGSSVYYE